MTAITIGFTLIIILIINDAFRQLCGNIENLRKNFPSFIHFPRFYLGIEVNSSETTNDDAARSIELWCLPRGDRKRRWVSKHERWWWRWLWIVEILFFFFPSFSSSSSTVRFDRRDEWWRENITQFMDTTELENSWEKVSLIYLFCTISVSSIHSPILHFFVISSLFSLVLLPCQAKWRKSEAKTRKFSFFCEKCDHQICKAIFIDQFFVCSSPSLLVHSVILFNLLTNLNFLILSSTRFLLPSYATGLNGKLLHVCESTISIGNQLLLLKKRRTLVAVSNYMLDILRRRKSTTGSIFDPSPVSRSLCLTNSRNTFFIILACEGRLTYHISLTWCLLSFLLNVSLLNELYWHFFRVQFIVYLILMWVCFSLFTVWHRPNVDTNIFFRLDFHSTLPFLSVSDSHVNIWKFVCILVISEWIKNRCCVCNSDEFVIAKLLSCCCGVQSENDVDIVRSICSFALLSSFFQFLSIAIRVNGKWFEQTA